MKRIYKVGLSIVGVLVIIYGLLVALARPVPNHPFFTQDTPLVIGHQGGEHLWPDNTFYAFEQAVELGVDVLEMDIHATADGVLVIMHDETIDRTTDGTGLIKEMTLAELKKLDAAYNWPHHDDQGERPHRAQGLTPPALEDLFQAFPHMPMNIEIKQTEPSITQPLCDLLQAYEMTEKVLIASFSPETMAEFRQVCPGVATAGAEPQIRTFFALNTLFLGAVYQSPVEAFQVPEYFGDLHVITPRFVQTAHSHNLDVHVWTVDEVEDMERLIGLGVDGIITNRPDRLLELLGR